MSMVLWNMLIMRCEHFCTVPKWYWGTNKIDYALTIDCAKQIAMLQRNKQGQQVRAYFIKCEELLKEKLKKMIDKYYRETA